MIDKIILIFGLSFITALSGALQPGPLLTYTFIQTLKAPQRGFSLGPKIVLGHAILELILITAILLGLAIFIQNPIFLKASGIVGFCFLLFLVATTLKDVFSKKDFNHFNRLTEKASELKREENEKPKSNFFLPVMAGALISMSNPFWWIWWITIGFIFMREYGISFQQPILVASFYLGHESADFLWYTFVSTAVYHGKKLFNPFVYRIILFCSALFLLGLAIYLLVSTLNNV